MAHLLHKILSLPYAYEKGVLDFVSAVLDPSLSPEFLADFGRLNRVITLCGRYSSLSQVLIRTFSPGTPDTYRGSELWDYSLVDPDNRRPVDFSRRAAVLSALKQDFEKDPGALAASLGEDMADGRIKLFILWRSLTFRRDRWPLFQEGEYIPLRAAGDRKENLFAFAWHYKSERLLVAAPRLLTGMTEYGEKPPLGPKAWDNTRLLLPESLKSPSWASVFTGESLAPGGRELRLADILVSFPVAALTAS